MTVALGRPATAAAESAATPSPLCLPITVRAPFPEGWAVLDPAQATVTLGGMTGISLDVRDLPAAHQLNLEVVFDASRLAVVDENPQQTGVQMLPGDWPSLAQTLFWPSVQNSDGWLRVTLWNFASPLSGSGTVARFRVRGRFPGPALLKVVAAEAGDRYPLSQPLGRGEVTITVTGAAP